MDYKERISKALSISTDTKLFEMGKCASEKAPAIFKQCFPGRKAVILADKNTWADSYAIRKASPKATFKL